MKTIEEIIEETAEEASKGIPSQKQKYIDLLHSVIEKGLPTANDLNVTPAVIEQLYELAYNSYNTGHYSDACSIFSWLVLLEPKNHTYLFGFASSYHMMKDYLQAIQLYMASFYLDPTNPIPFYHMADCFIKLNAPANAAVALGLVSLFSEGNPMYFTLKERAELIRNQIEDNLEKTTKKNGELQPKKGKKTPKKGEEPKE